MCMRAAHLFLQLGAQHGEQRVLGGHQVPRRQRRQVLVRLAPLAPHQRLRRQSARSGQNNKLSRLVP